MQNNAKLKKNRWWLRNRVAAGKQPVGELLITKQMVLKVLKVL